MTLTNIFDQEVTLTENEIKVVNFINESYLDGNECLCCDDIEYGTGLNNKVTRGILSSMTKKNLIDVNREDGLISKFWK